MGPDQRKNRIELKPVLAEIGNAGKPSKASWRAFPASAALIIIAFPKSASQDFGNDQLFKA